MPAPGNGRGELDPAAIARLTALDPIGAHRLIPRVIEAFASSGAQMLPQLRRAAATGDLLLLRRLVHTLKSSSANVGAVRLSSFCGALELQLRQGIAQALVEAAEEIAAEVTAVEAALRRLPGADA